MIESSTITAAQAAVQSSALASTQPGQPCATCGNVYDKAFEVRTRDVALFFDSFECAVAKLAPECVNCGCRVIGHGVESERAIYCSAHCAKRRGERGFEDRTG